MISVTPYFHKKGLRVKKGSIKLKEETCLYYLLQCTLEQRGLVFP
uniref:Uncharacterized protein n=1 Tax=Lotus japonicus TaxID=34305 RepID=I3SGB4_LOTJA|nr:unknown [Lotus japonicus]